MMTNILYPSPSNITTINDFFLYSNTLSGGVFGYGVLVIIFLIAYLRFSMAGKYETMVSLRASLFVVGLAAVLEYVMGWIGYEALLIAITFNLVLLLIDYKR